MNPAKPLIDKLETLLAEGFSAKGSSLEEQVNNLGEELPEELRTLLLAIARANSATHNSVNDLLEFAFLCGQAHGRLENCLSDRLAANIASFAPDGTPPLELENGDFNALAGFVALRNRFLKVVADYTLKFLLVSAVLLFIGLSLGLI